MAAFRHSSGGMLGYPPGYDQPRIYTAVSLLFDSLFFDSFDLER